MLFITRTTSARTAQAVSVAACRRVLLAWLCVLLVGGMTPWVKAGQGAANNAAAAMSWGWEQACSASGQTHWIPSPVAQKAGADALSSAAEAQAQTGQDRGMHWLDCPLCQPLLAPPPLRIPAGGAGVLATILLPRAYTQPLVQHSAVLPPSRAPPWITSKFIAA